LFSTDKWLWIDSLQTLVSSEDVSGNDADHGKLRGLARSRVLARVRAWGAAHGRAGRCWWGWSRIAGGAASQEGRAGKHVAAVLCESPKAPEFKKN